MKLLKTITFVLIGLFSLALFLPFEIHDVYSGGNWKSSGVLIENNVQTPGIKSIEAIVVLAYLILIALVSLLKRTYATAIVRAVMGFISLVGIPFLYLFLIFQLFDTNNRMGIGMGIAFFVIAVYFIVLVINLVVEFRKRKRNPSIVFDDIIDIDF